MVINSFTFLHFFILIGCLQGLLLAFLLLSNKKFQKRTNKAIALSLCSTAFLGIVQLLNDLNVESIYPIVPFLPIKYTIINGFSLYYYILLTIDKEYKFSRKDALIISPFLVQLLIDFFLFFAYLIFPEFILSYTQIHDSYINVKELVSVGFSFLVFVWALKVLYGFPIERQNTLTGIEANRLLWLRNNTIAVFIVWSSWAVPQTYAIIAGQNFWWLYYPTWIGMILLAFWLGYFVILKREYFEVNPINASNGLSKKAEVHYKKLLDLMRKEKIYKDPELNMELLAKRTKLSIGYLSRIINQKEGKNFYEFVNSYRIEEVKANLVNPKYAHYSILGIGLEAGFKSKSTFNATFKKLTGKTPSAFKKQLG